MPKKYSDEILQKAYDLIVNRKYNKAFAVLEQSCESSKSIRVELSGKNFYSLIRTEGSLMR